MKLESLSASSIKTFQSCEAKWRAIYEGAKDRGESGEAAQLGTACHAALEIWFDPSYPAGPLDEFTDLEQVYSDWVLDNYDITPQWFEDGKEILRTWYDRQEWDLYEERRLISVERKAEFDLKTSIGTIPFKFVIDRLDLLDDGDYEVVDYKSGFFMVKPDDLKRDVQAKSYALAVWLEYNQPDIVWVTFDYLRSDTTPATVGFKAREIEEHYAWLQSIAEEIIESDGLTETPDMCQWCPRVADCDRITELPDSHIEALDLEMLSELRAQALTVTKGLDALKDRIDKKLRLMLDEADDDEFVSGDATLKMALGRRSKDVDLDVVFDALDLTATDLPLKITGGEYEKFLKRARRDELYDPSTMSKLESAVHMSRGTPQIKVVKP